MKTNLVPKNGNVILHWDTVKESVTESGIVIADSGKKRGEFATVVATFPDSIVNVGDKVLFNKLSGQFVQDDRFQEFLIIKETEIYGVLEE